MTTRKQADALRSQLVSLTQREAEVLRYAIDGLDAEDRARLIPELVRPVITQAAVLTAAWYDSLLPTSRFRVSSDQNTVSEGRINYTTAWAWAAKGTEDPIDRMLGAFQRMVFDGSRGVVIDNAKREGAQWHRDAQEKACSFCRLLTVDPNAYNGKYVDMSSHNHDCRCIAVVSRGDNPYIPPPYVQRWKDEVEADKSGNLTETLAAMNS